MSKHSSIHRLRHMLDYAKEASELVKDKTRGDLDSDRLLNLALVRLYVELPWAQIVALRNRLIHGYDSVDFDILWQIVTQDLPPLIVILENIIPPERSEP